MRELIGGISLKEITILAVSSKKKYCKKFQEINGLVVDGIAGTKTRAKIRSLHIKHLVSFLVKQHFKDKRAVHNDWYLTGNKKRDSTMLYLANEEGEFLHRHKTESGRTSPFGLYWTYNSDAEIFSLFQKIESFLGITKKLEHEKINILNNILNYDISIRAFTVKSVYEHYILRYSIPSINKNLMANEAVSFLSISILCGLRRATRFLQYSLGVSQDGIFGKKTLLAIEDHYRVSINDLFLDKTMEYLKAIGDKRHINGWTNRVNRLRKNKAR